MGPIKKNTYSEQVVEYIKRMILEGYLLPGEQIKESELSKHLGISRAPVREAMQTLVTEGLVSSKPQKSKYITALTSKEIINSYFAGGVLEAAAVGQVLDLYTDDDFAALQQIVHKMEECAEKKLEHCHLAELDDKFHLILFSRIDNELLVQLCHRSCQGISKFLLFRYWITLFTPEEVCRRHQAIVDALIARDSAQVELEIRNHYIESGARMSQYGTDKIAPLFSAS